MAQEEVEDPPHLYPLIGVRVGTSLGAHQKPSVCEASFLEIFGVVVFIAQYETCLLGQLLDQQRGDTAVVDVGRNRATLTRYILPTNP